MKLSQLTTSNLIKILVYGEAGSGKTCFAAGFPTPMLYLDFDNKISSAARFFAADKARLEGIEVKNLSAQIKGDPLVEMNKIIDELINQQGKGAFEYKTLVLDSITTFSSAVIKHIIRTNPGIKRVKSGSDEQPCLQDYGILKREFERLIPGLLTLNMNIVMLGHVEIMKDDLTGELIRGVMMDGNFSQKLPIYFEEVSRSFVDDKGVFLLQTKPDAKFAKIRSQIPGIPNVVPLKYESLAKRI